MNVVARCREPLRAVLFDLDGTLIDSAPDIAAALNVALRRNRLPPLAEADVANMIGRGPPVLVERALAANGGGSSPELAQRVLDDYLRAYEKEHCRRDTLFDDAAECLATLHARGLPLAVVTNKYQRFAVSALQHHGIAEYVTLVVGGDTLPQRKPDPEPLLHACRMFGVDPAQVLMVGDSANDVAAARAAGCSIVCVPHGYHEGGAGPRALGVPIIPGLRDLLAWIDAHGGTATHTFTSLETAPCR